MVEPLLQVEHLRVEIPGAAGVVALDDISFSLAPGEVLGLVGESGAGKSLTGSAIVNLLTPPLQIAGGEVRLRSQRIDNLPMRQMRAIRGKRIGFVFQDPLTSLNPVLTVGRQLTETIRTHLGLTKDEARGRAIEWLNKVGIPAPENMIEHYPHQFSGGMRQRIVIALALCAEPDLLIADEPTTALDVSVQAQILKLLLDLHNESGISIILITHDMGVIAQTADRVAVMYAGRIVEIGTVNQVVRRPGHPYTTGLMDSIVKLGERKDRLFQIPGTMPRLTNIPAGCAFHPRCPHANTKCHHRLPELQPAGESRVACWKAGEISQISNFDEM